MYELYDDNESFRCENKDFDVVVKHLEVEFPEYEHSIPNKHFLVIGANKTTCTGKFQDVIAASTNSITAAAAESTFPLKCVYVDKQEYLNFIVGSEIRQRIKEMEICSGHSWHGYFIGSSDMEWEVALAVNILRQVCIDHEYNMAPLTFVRDRIAYDCVSPDQILFLRVFQERTVDGN